MAYNDVPLAAQRIKDSQAPIRQNFQDIQTDFSANHVPIDDPSGNGGKQQFIQFPNVHIDADMPTAVGEVGILPKTGFLGAPALFFRAENNATVPSTGFTECVAAAVGWTRLPCGILIKWGVVSVNSSGSITRNFNTGPTIPVFATTPFYYQFTPERVTATPPTATIYIDSFGGLQSATQFTMYITTNASGGNTLSVRWLAIGT